MFITVILVGLNALLLSAIQPVHTQEVKQNANACTTAVNRAINSEYEWYQIKLFGQPEASKAPIGSVHFDKKGNPWRKMETGRWRTGEEKNVGLTWRDPAMNSESLLAKETDGKESWYGIFQTKRVLTSELVPFIGVELGSLQCRLEHLCQRIAASSGVEGTDIEEVGTNVLGCMPFTGQTLASCQKDPEGNLSYSVMSVTQYCDQAKIAMMEHASQMTLAAVELDAAYRSLYQLAGNFDALIAEGQLPFLDTLQRTVHLMGSFHRLPCLVSSCDASPLPEEAGPGGPPDVPPDPVP